MLKVNGIVSNLGNKISKNNKLANYVQKTMSSPVETLAPVTLAALGINIAKNATNTSITNTPTLSTPSYNAQPFSEEEETRLELTRRLKSIQAPDGSFPYQEDEKSLNHLLKFMRGGEQGELQIKTLQELLKNKHLKIDDITNIVRLTKKEDRAQFWIEQAKILGDKYKPLTGKEISEIVPNLRQNFLETQNNFIRNVYVKHKNQVDEHSLDIFCNLLSSLKYTEIADLQLNFFNKLIDDRKVAFNTAMDLVSNLTEEETGKLKMSAILTLIDKGMEPEDLLMVIPKIKNAENANLQGEMCDYFLKDKKMDSFLASRTMANIPSVHVFNVQRCLVDRISKYRDLASKDIFLALGDVQSKTKADLKLAFVNEIKDIEKVSGENIVQVLTNVDNIYTAEVKAKTMKNLAQIDKLSGDNITFITKGTYNDEASKVKIETAKRLAQHESMSGDAITAVVSRVLTKEIAELQIKTVEELLVTTNFTDDEIASMAKHVKNLDHKAAKMNAIKKLQEVKQLSSKDIVQIVNAIQLNKNDGLMLKAIDMLKEDPEITSKDIKNIATTIQFDRHTYQDLINFILTIPQDVRSQISNYSIIQDFYQFKDSKPLDKNDKKALMRALIKHNGSIFRNENKAARMVYPFLPDTAEQYCHMVSKLAKSCATSAVKLTEADKKSYFDSINNLANPNGVFVSLDLSDIKNQPKLAYTREEFVSDVKAITKDLTPEEATALTSHFSFSVSEFEGKPTIKGYPSENPKAVAGERFYEKSIELGKVVSKFVSGNSVIIENQPTLEKDINNILKVMPELVSAVQKEQNPFHAYSLFTHTLSVLQNTFKNPKYALLEDTDKKLLASVCLLHDVSKAEYVVDKTHQLHSACDAYEILDRFDFSEADRSKAYSIIRNHEWLKFYNKSNISDLQRQERAKLIAFSLREGNAFELESILCEADLKGMDIDGSFFKSNQQVLKEASIVVAGHVKDIQETAIPLPQTQLPKASELKVDGQVIRSMNIDGTKNKVIYLNKNINLSKALGIHSDTEDFSVLVHGLDSEKNALIFQFLNEIDSDNLLSTSYVNLDKGNWKVFRQQGFILDVESDNIHAAYFKDFGSGDGKDVRDLLSNYLFGGYRKPQRDYISNLIKQKLNISDDAYRDLYEQIKNKPFEQIKEEFPFVALAIKEIFMDMQGGEYTYGRNYNEILITRPRIQGVFAYDKSITQVPKFLREYAQNHDIPIIIFED